MGSFDAVTTPPTLISFAVTPGWSTAGNVCAAPRRPEPTRPTSDSAATSATPRTACTRDFDMLIPLRPLAGSTRRVRRRARVRARPTTCDAVGSTDPTGRRLTYAGSAIVLRSRNSSRPAVPISRPIPDCL